MRTVRHNGVSLVTQSFGDASDPAVLLIMGATASMLGWPDEFCDRLAACGFRVIRFDHRDTGGSTTAPPGQACYAVEDMASDAMAILDDHGIERAHVVGMSLGGYIAQMLALSHPRRIRSLTLIASEPLGWDGDPLPHVSGAFLDHFARLEGLDWSDPEAVTAFMVQTDRLCAGTGATFDEQRAELRARRVLARTDSPASMFNHASLTTREDWTGRFREIACRVLVLHGADDPILPLAHGKALAAGISGAALAVLSGIGHELPLSALPDLTDRVAAHLGATS